VSELRTHVARLEPGTEVPFCEAGHCWMWIAMASPRGFDYFKQYTEQLPEIVRTWKEGQFAHYYPIMLRALEHCVITQDVSLMTVLFFQFAAHVECVWRWLLLLNEPEWRRHEFIPRLPEGCEQQCRRGIRAACKQYAKRSITSARFSQLVFAILATGCENIGEPGWTEPPMPTRCGGAKRPHPDVQEVRNNLRTAAGGAKRRRTAAAAAAGGAPFDPRDSATLLGRGNAPADSSQPKRRRTRRVTKSKKDQPVIESVEM